jgi:hypothetical protein
VWSDKKLLRSGKASIQLHTLTLAGENCGPFRGAGSIEWVAGRTLKFRSITDGARADLKETHFGTGSQFGQLIPPENYLRLDGSTVEGWSVQADGIDKDEKTYHSGGENFTSWDVDLRQISIMTEDYSQNPGMPFLLGRLTGGDGLTFGRVTTQSNDNPRFGSTSFSHDWLESRTQTASIAIRRAAEGIVEIRIDGSSDVIDVERLLESTRLAISFLVGRAARVQGFLVEGDRREMVRLFGPPARVNRNFASRVTQGPFRVAGQSEMTELILGSLTDFFETDKGRDFARYLMMYWDVQDNGITVKVAVTCQVIEAMVRLVRGEKVGNDRTKKIVNVLERWTSQGVLGFEKADLEAWGLRNKTGHGELMYDPAKGITQQTVDRLSRLENMVNRLILQAMSYRGSYHDVAKRWTTFNPASHDELTS